MSTCNQLDLQTLGSQLVMLKILPDHCARLRASPPSRKKAGSRKAL